MVDADKARRLLGVLLDSIADLRRYQASVTLEALNAQRDTQHMVLHALYVAAQATVDLALHLAADTGQGQVATYQAVFHRLADAGVLDAELSRKLAGWAGFRNVLAHFYATIDQRRVHAALSELDDLERFAALVSSRLAPED